MLNILMLGHVSTHPVLTWGAEKWRRVKNCSSTSGHLRPTPRLSHLPADSHVKMQHYSRSKHTNSLLLEPVSSRPFWQLYCFLSFLPHLFKLCWGLKSGRGGCETGSCRPVSVIHLQFALTCGGFQSKKQQRSDDQNHKPQGDVL